MGGFMSEQFVSRKFQGRRASAETQHRLPPGQHAVTDFPVLSAGLTPQVTENDWRLTIEGLVQEPITWRWEEFLQLPQQEFVVDIHCVTAWSKFDTRWRGVSIDTLLEQVTLDLRARYVAAYSYGGYTTNLPIQRVDQQSGIRRLRLRREAAAARTRRAGAAGSAAPVFLEERQVA